MKNIGFIVLFMLIAGVNAFSQRQWTVYTEEDGLPSNHITCITAAPDNSLWIGAANGFSHFDGRTFETFDFLFDDPTFHIIYSMEFSNNGIMWVAADADGLLKYDGTNWTKYKSGVDSLQGPLYKSVIYAAPAPDNSVWVASREKIGKVWHFAVSHFDRIKWEHYTKNGEGDEFILTDNPIAVAPDGSVWIMALTPNTPLPYKLMHFDGTSWTYFKEKPNFQFSLWDCIVVSDDNSVYFGINWGIGELKNNIYKFITPQFNQFGEILFIVDLKILPGNILWACFTSAGFGKYDGTQWDFYMFDGFESKNPDNIAVDSNGIVWLGYNSSGLVKFEPNYVSVENENITPFKIIGNYPNPFNSSTTINFEIEKTCKADINVYSLTGQHIKKLTSAIFQKGNHNILWKGDDDYGRIVSSGIYLIQLKNDSNQNSVLTTFLK